METSHHVYWASLRERDFATFGKFIDKAVIKKERQLRSLICLTENLTMMLLIHTPLHDYRQSSHGDLDYGSEWAKV